MLYFHFIQFNVFLNIPLEILSLTCELFRSMLFGFQVFRDFPVILLYWFLVWFHCGHRIHSILFPLFFNLLRLVLWHRIRCNIVCSMGTWKECVVFSCWIQCFINVKWETPGQGYCWVLLYILAAFLSSGVHPRSPLSILCHHPSREVTPGYSLARAKIFPCRWGWGKDHIFFSCDVWLE